MGLGRSLLAWVTALGGVFGLHSGQTRGQAVYTEVFRAGSELIDGGGGTGSFAQFNDVSIGAGGHVVMRGFRTPASGTGVAVGTVGGTTKLIASTGQTLPGIPAGTSLSLITDSWPDSSGRVLIGGDISGTGITNSNNKTFWIYDGSALRLVVREGTTPPGLPAGAVLANLNDIAFSNGRVAFLASLSGTGVSTANDLAIWLFNGTSLTLVARKGSGSGVVSGATWTDLDEPVLNENGELAFAAAVSGALTSDSMIVTGAPGALTIAARELAPAPGAGAGVRFNGNFASDYPNRLISFNDSGELIYRGNLDGTGVSIGNDGSAHRRTGPAAGGVGTMFAREGDLLTPAFPQVSSALGPPMDLVIGGSGVAAFRTDTTGPLVTDATSTVIYRRIESASTPLRFIVGEGRAVPDAAAGIEFGSSASVFRPECAINQSGQMLLRVPIVGPSINAGSTVLVANDPANSDTLRIGRPSESVILQNSVAATGSLSQVTAGPLGPTQGGRPTCINDAGRAALIAILTAGGSTFSGVYVTSLAPPAASGACCDGATCSAQPPASCSGAGRSFAGTGTVCNTFGANNAAPCCFADFNHLGGVTVQDVFDFLAAFFAASPRADINGAGGVTIQDVFDYLAAYFAGCA